MKIGDVDFTALNAALHSVDDITTNVTNTINLAGGETIHQRAPGEAHAWRFSMMLGSGTTISRELQRFKNYANSGKVVYFDLTDRFQRMQGFGKVVNPQFRYEGGRTQQWFLSFDFMEVPAWSRTSIISGPSTNDFSLSDIEYGSDRKDIYGLWGEHNFQYSPIRFQYDFMVVNRSGPKAQVIVEINVPTRASNMTLWCSGPTGYLRFVSGTTVTSGNFYYLDQSKGYQHFGANPSGIAVYFTGTRGLTATRKLGETGFSNKTYSQKFGTESRIGFGLRLPSGTTYPRLRNVTGGGGVNKMLLRAFIYRPSGSNYTGYVDGSVLG